MTGTQIWRHRTPKTQLALWVSWVFVVALFVWCWNTMTARTMWLFVYDAPNAAGDLIGRALPPRWSYMEKLWAPLWDTINIATLGTLLGILIAVPLAFLAAHFPIWYTKGYFAGAAVLKSCLSTFVIGLLLGYVARRSGGSVWGAVFAHSMHNLIVITLV